jgi:TPP-dependent pyruvate/acetoin dehydrogenase alpha subunit
VDGNDARRVRAPAARSSAPAPAKGVTLIEVMTYRRLGHAQHDNQSYQSVGGDRAVGDHQRSDRPLHRHPARERLGEPGGAGAHRPRSIAELDAAVAEADASPLPEPKKR